MVERLIEDLAAPQTLGLLSTRQTFTRPPSYFNPGTDDNPNFQRVYVFSFCVFVPLQVATTYE
jgi:hypothetical protein